MAMTTAERLAKLRNRRKDLGLRRAEMWVPPETWPTVHLLCMVDGEDEENVRPVSAYVHKEVAQASADAWNARHEGYCFVVKSVVLNAALPEEEAAA